MILLNEITRLKSGLKFSLIIFYIPRLPFSSSPTRAFAVTKTFRTVKQEKVTNQSTIVLGRAISSLKLEEAGHLQAMIGCHLPVGLPDSRICPDMSGFQRLKSGIRIDFYAASGI